MANKFRSLLGLLQEIIEGETNVTLEMLAQRVELAYDNNELTGTQYDKLMGEIQEYL